MKPDPVQTRISRLLRRRETWAEKLVWAWLRDRRFSAYKFRRQHPFGPFILDFFCEEAGLDIELDGFQHGTPSSMPADLARDSWLETHGIRVLRYWNSQLRRNQQAIRDSIWAELNARSPRVLPEFQRPGVVGENRRPALKAGDHPHPCPLPEGEGACSSASIVPGAVSKVASPESPRMSARISTNQRPSFAIHLP